MVAPVPLPPNEAARLRSLRLLGVLDTPPEEHYEDLVALAARLLGCSGAAVNLVDSERQWTKARFGDGGGDREMARGLSFCAHSVLQDDVLVVPDATQDPRFADNPVVTGPAHVRFYAGAPLVLGDGARVGSLCVYDSECRAPTPDQIRTLAVLARQVVVLLELREARLRYRAIMAATGHVLVQLEPDGAVLSLGPTWHALTGQQPDELIGRPFDELAVPASQAAVRAVVEKGLCTTEHRSLEVRLHRSNGGDVPVLLQLASLTADSGQLLGHLGTAVDITMWQQREVEARHAQKLEALGRLAAGLAHEVNTPIQFVSDNTRFLAEAYSSMLGLLQTYRGALGQDNGGTSWQERQAILATAEADADVDWLEQEIPGAVQQSLDGVERVASLVRAMKSFSYKDQDHATDADLGEALRTTITVARNETKYVADVDLDLGELPPVRCHLGDLNQVFLNLLVNAADAIGETGRRGRIRVATWVADGHAVVEISDDGPGIPDHIRDRIFEPFFTTKGVGRGTGQGLALARSVVHDRHGGRIDVLPAAGGGGGTRFLLWLPLHGPAAPDQAAA